MIRKAFCWVCLAPHIIVFVIFPWQEKTHKWDVLHSHIVRINSNVLFLIFWLIVAWMQVFLDWFWPSITLTYNIWNHLSHWPRYTTAWQKQHSCRVTSVKCPVASHPEHVLTLTIIHNTNKKQKLVISMIYTGNQDIIRKKIICIV